MVSAIEPQRAIVTPRVRTCAGGEPVPIDDAVESVLAEGRCGAVLVRGGPGSGRSTALRHLAALSEGLAVFDLAGVHESETVLQRELQALAETRLVVYSRRYFESMPEQLTWTLCPWTEDDVIAYAVARHGERSRAVLSRALADPLAPRLDGSPALWTLGLDALADDSALQGLEHALWHGLLKRAGAGGDHAVGLVFELAAEAASGSKAFKTSVEQAIRDESLPASVFALLRHRCIVTLFIAAGLAMQLRRGRLSLDGSLSLTPALIQSVTTHLAADEGITPHLEELQSWARPPFQSLIAIVLLCLDSSWRPSFAKGVRLDGARLDGADWPGVDLEQAVLVGASLEGAVLESAKLRRASMRGANLSRARLSRADLDGLDAVDAKLTRADFRGCVGHRPVFDRARLAASRWEGAQLVAASFQFATMEEARFDGAQLERASFVGASLDGASFEGADLSGARLSRIDLTRVRLGGARLRVAVLDGCRLEGQHLAGVDLEHAYLIAAVLSAACLSGARLGGANLRKAVLGEVDLEGADLRDADLSGVSFHMGSTRGGLIFSSIASYGTRTGFYTNELDERHFKAPEEIRKANLRGVDLRGAVIAGVDFYLVDLRGAVLDPPQRAWLARCGAILDTPS